MKTAFGHLGYCTNIHGGEAWADHFHNIRAHVPAVKKRLSPGAPFGIGLRIANSASEDLLQGNELRAFQEWLQQEDCYVFTLNGFPYGGFHGTVVKDAVHAPDWTTRERVAYTKRLADILAVLLPEGLDGGISTSPLSYKPWHPTAVARKEAMVIATAHLLEVILHLVGIKASTGRSIHIDLEPEPGGLIETGAEFIHWYETVLLPEGTTTLAREVGFSAEAADAAIREHLQLCFDICHYAVGFEDVEAAIAELEAKRIRVGKIQVSAALRAPLPDEPAARMNVIDAFRAFDEPTYLHQVVALTKEGARIYYDDLPAALADAGRTDTREWRAHFHVPLFVDDYGLLRSTRPEIKTVLALQQQRPFTAHLEVETYTWDVSPEAMKLPLTESIARELEWVNGLMKAPHLSTSNTNV
ncbi:metabolite traffic protein EboE [Flaviaesturariibacter amylovorans]|uniref:Metabolite traffic protein EboE n=1 Tax=Flaviaesturariibacter amylovorans TaxID=1084520 RepID=A0ABP8HSF6_9BACT